MTVDVVTFLSFSLQIKLRCGTPALSTKQVEMTSRFSLGSVQLLSLQALGGRIMPCPGHVPTIRFPSVISDGVNPNSSAFLAAPGIALALSVQ